MYILDVLKSIYISYVPDIKMVESKSLKLYLFSFRNHGDFHEDVVNIIMKDLVKLLEPRYLEVWGKFLPRGGISIDPYTNYGKPGTKFEELAWQRFSQHDLVAMDKVDERCENYGEMADKGYLVRNDRGNACHMTWMGNTTFYDTTNPGARQFVWDKCKENYYKKGIRIFWLDEAEPEYGTYEFDNYRYYAGPALQCTNIYPVMYAKGFYDGLKAEGEKEIMSLVRCAWAGSQKYGVLTWSGDISSTFRAMREQLQAGLNMGMAGIPWWTSDIGGFIGGDIKDPGFQELLVRWFAWGAFCPVFRMHGERSPWYEREQEFINGVRQLTSGQDNEVWSFGEENYKILTKYLFLREKLRPYVRKCMEASSRTGEPVMRPLFFDFPEDPKAWETEDVYMFGKDILVAPVMEPGVSQRQVYLPKGAEWTEISTGKVFQGGKEVAANAPLDVIPVFTRSDEVRGLF